jgi:YesN/AraC family two-component response regulator
VGGNNRQGIEAPSKRYACLAVDDYPPVLEALSELLSPQYDFYRAKDGLTALRLLGHHQIDVVLLDLKLPGLDGIEVLRRIRELYPTLPVLFLTGHSHHRAVIMATNLFISGYLEKPFDNNELLEKVRNALSWVLVSRADYERASDQNSTSLAAAAAQLIQKSFADALTVETISGKLGTSPRKPGRAFHKEYNQTIGEYIISIRIAEAVKLLRSSDLSVKAVGYSVGYHSLDKFHRHFLRLTHRTPLAFRQLNT